MGDFSDIGGVPVLGFISPADTMDKYAVTDPFYAIGGLRIINNGIIGLNEIPEGRRRAGMIVGINNGERYYKLLNKEWDYSISDWELWNFITLNNDEYELDPNLTTNLTGAKLFSNRITQLTTENNVLDISLTDNNILINVKSDSSYNIVLPPLHSLPLGFKISFKNLHNDGLIGTIIPWSTNLIESKDSFEFFGKGFFEITKMSSSDGVTQEWVLTHYSNIIETKYQGKSKKLDFSGESTIYHEHNLGYIPITQVWVSDGNGGYSDVSVDIDHETVNKDNFTIQLGTPLDGFVLYV